jgi:hypothetical protein
MNTCLVFDCETSIHERGMCRKHYLRWWKHGDPLITKSPTRGLTLEEKFRLKVDMNGPLIPDHHDLGKCWLWTDKPGRGGYGVIHHQRRCLKAHRVSYELFVESIPQGFEPDHLCHTYSPDCVGGDSCPHRPCVSPAHLELVTSNVNWSRGLNPAAINARKTHCIRDHEFTPENTRIDRRGGRQCRTCDVLMGRRI